MLNICVVDVNDFGGCTLSMVLLSQTLHQLFNIILKIRPISHNNINDPKFTFEETRYGAFSVFILYFCT